MKARAEIVRLVNAPCRLAGCRAFPLVLVVLGILSPATWGADEEPVRTRLKIGFNQSNFVGLSRNDAAAAIKAFTESAAKRRGYAVQTQIEVYETAAEFSKGIKEQGVQLAIIDSWDYLSLDVRAVLEPMFVFVEPLSPLESYLLLTPRDKGALSLADLRGKEVVLLQNINANLSQYWLETLLLEQGLGAMPAFFGKVEVVPKPSAAVLPVFFGQRTACVVDQSAFDLMVELNPQVGRRLQAIATSKPYLDTLLCFSREGWQTEQGKKDMAAGLAELHTEPGGQQILTVFKVSKLEPFKDEFLDSVKELKATHDRLKAAFDRGEPVKSPASKDDGGAR